MTTATPTRPQPTTQAPVDLRVWRCPSCNTMLAKVALAPGSVVEIKCPRCNAFAVKEAA